MSKRSKRLKYFLMLNVLPPLVYALLRLLHATYRVKQVNDGFVTSQRAQGESFIACFWHGRLLAMPFALWGSNAKVLISRHGDGEFITRVMRFFGLGAVRGSYRKEGSISSLREMAQALKSGTIIAITPDGPKGPRYVVKRGLTEVARISGRPIVPVTCSATKKKPSIHGTDSYFPTLFRPSSSCGATPSMWRGMLPVMR
jgi:lysophospholipid acyltransferase (LPLAT)-like uncharacterized protein